MDDANPFKINRGGYLKNYTGTEKDVRIPDGVKKIARFAFWHTKTIESVTIPESVKTIEREAFFAFPSLKKITILGNRDGREFHRIAFPADRYIEIETDWNPAPEENHLQEFSIVDFPGNENQKKYLKRIKAEKWTREYFNGLSLYDTYYFLWIAGGALDQKFIEKHPEFKTFIREFSKSQIIRKMKTTANTIPLVDGNRITCTIQELPKISADDIEAEDITLKITGRLSRGIGSIRNWCTESRFNGKIHLDISEVTELDKIPEKAFSISKHIHFNGFLSVKLPETITEIGDEAFSSCNCLKEINIPASVTRIGCSAFHRCAFTSVRIPDGISEIHESAFSSCENLKTVILPKSIRKIGDMAFYHCTSLEPPENLELVEDIGSRAFERCSFPENFKLKTGEYEFRDSLCLSRDKERGLYIAYETNINSKILKVPKGVKTIYVGQFQFNKTVEEIILPRGLKTIHAKAFSSCRNLRKIKIPSSVSKIGYSAFDACESLEKIEIPKGIRIIGSGTFYGCDSLRTVILPKTTEEIGSGSFEYCKSLKSLEIPPGVKKIGFQAFHVCSELEKVVIPGSVVEIEEQAFLRCPKLKEDGIVAPAWVDKKRLLDGEGLRKQ